MFFGLAVQSSSKEIQMRKITKKLSALALAALFAVGLAGTAFAGGGCSGFKLRTVHVPTFDQSVAEVPTPVVIKPGSGS